MRKPGCLVLFIIAIVLIISGLLIGPLAKSFIGEGVPEFIQVQQPHIELKPETIIHAGILPVTNTLLAALLTTVTLLLIFGLAARKMSIVPRGLQNLVEMIVEGLLSFAEGVAGKENGRRFFPLFATIFLFVIANAWLSLVPLFGAIGVEEHGTVLALFRGANTDINVPAALAIMSFIFVEYWGIRSVGFFPYMSKFVRISYFLPKNFKGIKSLGMNLVMGIIDLFVGAIELLSELIRLVSFTFRLFGNMTAGEILLLVSMFLIPWVFSDLFYGLELLVGLIQALIFGGLTLVFATMAVTPHGEEH
ncbi:MAG: F0F1 ATP synthase subunit A [Dehalococcoidia bacterium]|nr:F0F1 ATP synthase subunit A [Dehalococcoidia bacterium]MDZ4247560.1 F0F1 ATP synthase subunit A [Dehalococcoidia bacterium]